MINKTTHSNQTPPALQAPIINEILVTYSDSITDQSITMRHKYDGCWIVTLRCDLYDDIAGDGVSQQFSIRAEAVAFFKAAGGRVNIYFRGTRELLSIRSIDLYRSTKSL